MKTYNNLYGKICSFDNLHLAFRKAKKGKSQRVYVKAFETNLESNLFQIKRELETMAYKPRPLRIFVIRDPKTRLISAPHFRDRVVHHALCNIIEPIFDRIFIHDSFASRKGKGTHEALCRFEEFKRKISCNGRHINGAKDNNTVIGYILKCDIKHYFASVDHETLMRVIRRKIHDANALWLMENVLSSYEPSGKGMPIGSLTSQLFANIYLNELDYFVKCELKAKYYIRYMDDFMLLNGNKDMLLEWKKMINNFLGAELKLELHPQKSNIFPLHNGICLLGYRIFYHHILLKKSNIGAMEDRMRKHEILFRRGDMAYEKAVQSFESWMSYAKYANSYGLRKVIARSFNHAFL